MGNSNFSCQDLETQMYYKSLYMNIGMALSIWIILSLIQYHPSKPWKWAPGIAIPINAIHASPHRVVYLLAFSAVSGDIMSLLLDRQPLFDYSVNFTGYSTSIATILKTMLAIADGVLTIVVDSVVYLPLFACIDAPVPFVGYILGIISVPFLVWRQVITVTSSCSDYSTDFWIRLAELLPIMLCLCAQFIWFCWRLVWTISRLIKGGPSLRAALFKHQATTYHICRVKSLLEGSSRRTQRQTKSFMCRALSFIYPYDSSIHLPLKFSAAVVVMMYATYWLTLWVSYDTVSVAVKMGVYLRGNASLVEEAQKAGIIGGFVLGLVYTAEVVLPAGPIIAFIWNLVMMMFMVRQVRIHIQKIARGDLSFVASIPSPSFRLLNSMKYTSYQIAYYVWSWLLIWILASLAGVVGYICYFLVKNYREQILLSIATAILPVAYSLIVNLGQLIFVKLLFVGDTNNKNTVIKNVKLFHVFSYFLFFHNIVIGLVSSFLRITLSMFFGVLFFFRLDRVVLMKGLERVDTGHSTYVSFLYLEHTQNNSVVHAFVDIIQAARRERAVWVHTTIQQEQDLSVSTEAYECLLPEDVPQKMPTVRPCRRWHVAYTMIRNPGVRSTKVSQDLQDLMCLHGGPDALQEMNTLPS